MQGNRILLSESEYRSRITPSPSPPSSTSPTPIFSDFSPFNGFSANRQSVDGGFAVRLVRGAADDLAINRHNLPLRGFRDPICPLDE